EGRLHGDANVVRKALVDEALLLPCPGLALGLAVHGKSIVWQLGRIKAEALRRLTQCHCCGSTATSVFTELAMKHSSWLIWWMSSSVFASTEVPDAKTIRGRSVTFDTHILPLGPFSMTPTASSS